MIGPLFHYFFYMFSVVWAFLKDLIRGELPFEEVKTNYLFGKANAFEQANMPRQAVKVYEQLLNRNEKSIAAILSLGGFYFRKKRYDVAIPYYEKVIRMNPKHYQGHYWLAMCYLKLGRYYAAINTLEEVIEFLPTFKDALNLMGECYEQIGEGAKAEHYYLKALGTDPKGIVLHRRMLSPDTAENKREERIKH